jgi:hypothetical protein
LQEKGSYGVRWVLRESESRETSLTGLCEIDKGQMKRGSYVSVSRRRNRKRIVKKPHVAWVATKNVPVSGDIDNRRARTIFEELDRARLRNRKGSVGSSGLVFVDLESGEPTSQRDDACRHERWRERRGKAEEDETDGSIGPDATTPRTVPNEVARVLDRGARKVVFVSSRYTAPARKERGEKLTQPHFWLFVSSALHPAKSHPSAESRSRTESMLVYREGWCRAGVEREAEESGWPQTARHSSRLLAAGKILPPPFTEERSRKLGQSESETDQYSQNETYGNVSWEAPNRRPASGSRRRRRAGVVLEDLCRAGWAVSRFKVGLRFGRRDRRDGEKRKQQTLQREGHDNDNQGVRKRREGEREEGGRGGDERRWGGREGESGRGRGEKGILRKVVVEGKKLGERSWNLPGRNRIEGRLV